MKREKEYPQPGRAQKQKKSPFWAFARGTPSHVILAVLIGAALVLGIFEPEKKRGNPTVIGSFGDFVVVETFQGKGVYEITLHKKSEIDPAKRQAIEKVSDIIWVVEHTHHVLNFHPIEKKGKIYGLIVTTDEK